MYVSQGGESHQGKSYTVEKFDASGGAELFAGSAEYISGNEITGVPGEVFDSNTADAPGSVAVNKEGNIYVLDADYDAKVHNPVSEGAVVEYNPEGLFVHAFTDAETPGLGADHEGWGTGSEGLNGVAVDPVTGDVFLSLSSRGAGEGAVDVFEPYEPVSGHLGKYVQQLTQTAGGAHLVDPEAMTVSSAGDLYVVDTQTKTVDVYGGESKAPVVTLAEASAGVVSGTVNPEGSSLSECAFQYVSEAHFKAEGFTNPGVAECVPGTSEIAAVKEPVAVHADLAGLLVSGTTYYYRLAAGNASGSAASEPLVFTAPHAPRVDTSSATDVSSAYAELRAEIDPLGADTTYYFEYGPRPRTARTRPR